MAAGSDKVVALRRLLDERFPAARHRETRLIPTGVRAIDDALDGGLLTGTLTEFVSECPSAGSQLGIASLLVQSRLARQRVALIDPSNAFDFESLDDDAIAHLVWVRCSSLDECWRATDLVARDPNFSAVIVDVRAFAPRVLLRTKDAIWTRLQRATEQAETALLIQSATAIVPNATRRISFSTPLPDQSLLTVHGDLVDFIEVELRRRKSREQTA